jgi:hypothetical protein
MGRSLAAATPPGIVIRGYSRCVWIIDKPEDRKALDIATFPAYQVTKKLSIN